MRGGHRAGMNRLCGRMAGVRTPALQAGERGQALLVAVLVLFAVAALAALFTAIIGSQVTQVGRYSEMVELRNIAEAGLNYANEQLTYGIAGADWRPPAGYRFRCGRGEFALSVDYGPDPARVQSRFVRIVSTASFPDNPFLRHTILGLKPVLLPDYALFITDRFSTGHEASLGAAGVELGGEPRTGYVYTISGPIRSNTDTVWYGASEVNLFTADAVVQDPNTWRSYGVLRDDRIEIAGSFRPANLAQDLKESLRLSINGVTRTGNLFWPVGDPAVAATEAYDYVSGFPDWTDGTMGAMVANTWRLLAELPERHTGQYDLYPSYLAVPRVQPPDIEAVNPDLQINRYLALTRDSGQWVKVSNQWVNTGAYGWGWTRFGGIYVDNTSDIQYQHDLEKLRRNWVGSVGKHKALGGDQRTGQHAAAPLPGPADWWDETGHYYAPPGAEIVLHGESACPYLEIIRHDAKGTSDDPYYWRDAAGNAIPMSDTDGYVYPSSGNDCVPRSTEQPHVLGKRAVFPFPPNGVVYVEGNVRIRGVMPPMRTVSGNATDFHGYFGSAAEYTADGRNRRYDLTVVSGGTIYVEGDLLGPRSAGQIQDSLEADMLQGSRVALLARDYVCVNTTAFNPRPREMFAGVPDPDNEGSFFWHNDRYPFYPPGGYPKQDLFQGPKSDEANSVDAAKAWDGTPLATDPSSIDFAYQNVRLRTPELRSSLNGLRLMMGHSGWYAVGGTGDPEAPPATETGNDQVAVDVALQIGQRDPATDLVTGLLPYPWEHGSELYTFLRPANPALDPDANDQSGHWYTAEDYLEFLANQYQAMPLPLTEPDPPHAWLSGDDVLRFTSRVSPVRHYDQNGVDRWQIQPKELGYLLGPVAITPPRTADPLAVRIEAMVYAQNGSWFVIPGPWFNEDPDEVPPADADTPEKIEAWYSARVAPAYHEPLNVRITFQGAITENMPAAMGDVADWTSKWAGRNGASGLYLDYEYDPLLRWSPVWQGTYLRFRSLPMTPDLVVWGERISGQEGP